MLGVHGHIGHVPIAEVYPVLVTLHVLPFASLLLVLGIIVTLENLLLKPAGALVEDGEELACEPFDLIDVGILVHVGVPRPILQGHWYLILGPLAG